MALFLLLHAIPAVLATRRQHFGICQADLRIGFVWTWRCSIVIFEGFGSGSGKDAQNIWLLFSPILRFEFLYQKIETFCVRIFGSTSDLLFLGYGILGIAR